MGVCLTCLTPSCLQRQGSEWGRGQDAVGVCLTCLTPNCLWRQGSEWGRGQDAVGVCLTCLRQVVSGDRVASGDVVKTLWVSVRLA